MSILVLCNSGFNSILLRLNIDHSGFALNKIVLQAGKGDQF